ncbi:amino acid transporter [Halarchaeum rubridurum]|uniref:Amino acid transporter n=1 Tax=Halarchaeum rubridurum TaxID=489911 RepID=A0A830FXS8_9EURY|nr:APC family permease [Halarchaeum rubridurum]MBP1953768.1 amino acid transporter [Halarchaeum rubridurum]GGM54539.1 amino acid transporter [Halarchaeum rubridurum]
MGTADESGGTNANRAGESPAQVGRPETVTDETTVTEEGTELERSIGLAGGVSIGVGTMIGAGIFVFPGLAAGRAGPAAAGSFAIGAVIALLVALPASELATAMPKSGGGYYFVSRALGALPGAVVGISIWLGLVFATAFYLVGFGNYAAEMLQQAGIGTTVAGVGVVTPLALVFGVLLTLLNLVGTENAAKLQNYVVGLLLSILVAFLGYGGLDALGVFGAQTTPEAFAPFGVAPVFTTAALVFTSYLGFAQVATVAGDIKNPGRNLPLAMVGSVLVVGVLYVATIFVATSAMGSAALRDAGETAIVNVADQFLGTAGVVAILLAGLLATVSSANASILSTSRAVFAVSKDALVPAFASRVNLEYGTPHVALAMAGGPVLVLVALGETEVLAEVASFLHLVMYGLMCVALVAMRRNEPEWYDPDFRVPAYRVVAGLGALASFGLIAFMQPASQLIGVAVMLAAAGWYKYYASDVTLKGVL